MAPIRLPANWPEIHAQDVVAALHGRWYGDYGLCFCPAHADGKTPALSIRQGADKVLLKCHAGCTGAAVARALHRLADGSTQWTPAQSGRNGNANDRGDLLALIERLWLKSIPVAGTRGEKYLRHRGILGYIPPTLRYLPRTKHGPSGLWLPAIIAPLRDPARRLISLHRTFLDMDRVEKAYVEPPRMLLGYPGDAAIELVPPGPILGIAEGIEKSLAAMEIHGCPVWSAASASRLAGVRIPADVHHLRIFADRNRPGLRAARWAARTHATPYRRITIEPPPRPADDWDAWLREQIAAGQRNAA